MKTHRIACSLALTLTAVAAAQTPAGVAPEMAKFDRMLGNWEGEGVVRPMPGGPEMPWTSTSTAKTVLGGHFVIDTMKIEVEGMPVPMILHSLSGWDAMHRRYVSFEMGNTGEAKESTVHFSGNKMIGSATGVEMGNVVTDSWVITYEGDEMHFKGLRSIAGGEFFVYVEGTSKRGGPGFELDEKTAAHAIAAPVEAMAPTARFEGTWEFTGEWLAAPDAEPMELTGREKYQPILGGHVQRAQMNGAGGGFDYQGLSYMAWCDADQCVVSFGADNMGEIHKAQCHMDGDKVIVIASGMIMGTPTTTRAVMQLESADHFTYEGTTTSGADDPYVNFRGTWKRAD